MNTLTNTRHTCALCLDDKLGSEMTREWRNKKPLWKCYPCMQDIFALEMELVS